MPNALIWGASGGIGRELVNTLKDANWTVYGAARQTGNIPSSCDEVFTFDVNKPDTFKEIALLLAQDNISLDLVVYAVGQMKAMTLENYTTSDWQEMMNINLNGAHMAVQSVLHLVPNNGHVMVIGAYTHKITLPRFGAYVTAKAALEPMMTIFAKENRKKNFTLVRPPAVNTAFWDNVPVRLPENALSPEIVAKAMLEHVEKGKNGTLDL